MNIRSLCAATVAIAGLTGAAYAQSAPPPPAPAPAAPGVVTTTQTSSTESHEHDSSVTTNDGAGSKTETTKSVDNHSSTSNTQPVAVTPIDLPPVVYSMPEYNGPNMPWRSVDQRGHIPMNSGPALYVWHDKNTVYITSTGGDAGRHVFNGAIEIEGDYGKFDTVKSIDTGANDHITQEGENRIAFRLVTGNGRNMFKFNLRGGNTIRFYTRMDGQPTQNVFFGATLAQAHSDPVIFDVRK